MPLSQIRKAWELGHALRTGGRSAECNSAIRQIRNLRYATGTALSAVAQICNLPYRKLCRSVGGRIDKGCDKGGTRKGGKIMKACYWGNWSGFGARHAKGIT